VGYDLGKGKFSHWIYYVKLFQQRWGINFTLIQGTLPESCSWIWLSTF